MEINYLNESNNEHDNLIYLLNTKESIKIYYS